MTDLQGVTFRQFGALLTIMGNGDVYVTTPACVHVLAAGDVHVQKATRVFWAKSEITDNTARMG